MEKAYGYICSPTEFAEKHLIYALGMGYIVNNNHFLIDRKFFPDYLLMFCCSGKLHIEQYGKSATLTAGQCCLMTLKDPHKYYSDAEDPCEIYWLHFGGMQAEELFPLICENSSKYVILQKKIILSLIQRSINGYQADNIGYCLEFSANVYQILLTILRSIMEAHAEDLFSPLTMQLEPFLKEHIGEKITLEMMAGHCHLNPAYFCRRFRAETNQTPMQYLMEKRIELARYYLLYTNEKISAIAKTLGFYDQNHFSFRYTKITGMSPSEYRKQNSGCSGA